MRKVLVVLNLSKMLLPLSAFFAGFAIYQYLNWNIFNAQPLVVTLAFGLFCVFVKEDGKGRPEPMGLILGLLSLCSGLYAAIFYGQIFEAAGNPSHVTVFFGSVMVILVLEAVRRTYGWVLTVVIAAFVVYPFLGPHLPYILQTRRFTYSRVVEAFYYQPDGLLGLPLGVCVSIVSVFIFLGICFQLSGASDYMSNLCLAVLGRSRGGPAKVAIISSASMGTITGSAAANVSTTGVVTIPLMKKLGYPPHFAGAVEAVASTGGVMTPPIMGAASFLMAEYLNLPYAVIMVAAVVPAFMYYLSLFIQVDFAAIKYGLQGLSAAELPRARDNLQVLYLMGVPIAILVLMLAVYEQDASVAGGVAVLGLVGISYVSRKTRLTPRKILLALKGSIAPLAELVVISAAAGLVVGTMMLTNLGQTITRVAFTVAGTSSLVALMIVAIAAIILGMGMPATPVYIILVFAAVPTLIKLGIDPLAAHLFVFYFGIMSFITPPICIASYVASAIAKSNPMKTAWCGLRLGIMGYIFPFIMVYCPGMLFGRGDILHVSFGILLSTVLVVGISLSVGGSTLRLSTRGAAVGGAFVTGLLLFRLF